VVAHRLTTVRDADLVVVVDAGRIAETGTPQDLLARGGHYARLVAAAGGSAGSIPRGPFTVVGGRTP
jgi:ABC-type multidrug transport system fused ATPase/permease subunit